jgi:general secretion pathway protein L
LRVRRGQSSLPERRLTLNIDRSLQLTSQSLRWWAAELRECANDLIGVLVPRRRRVLNVYWGAARLLIVDENAPEPKIVVEIPGGPWPETIPDELKLARERSNRVRVFVSGEKAFVRQFQVPLAVLPHLDSAIALQLPKLLPLDANELLTDFEVAASDSTSNAANIDLAALKKADVNPFLNHLRAWGLQIVSTHLGEPTSIRRFRFSADGVLGYSLKLQKSDRILVGVAATLGLACASVAATESYRSQVLLEHAKIATRAPAAAALAHRQELLARLEPLHALAEREAAPSATAILADLTMLVPQNTWLTTLELKDRHLRIVGVSPNSGSVVKLMSSSQLLNDVALRSSMSLGIGTGLDRFELTAELKGPP